MDNVQPFVIPTLYGYDSEYIYIHGSSVSRMLKTVQKGFNCCVTITLLDSLILAKAAFHHSANYRSVCIFGKGMLINDENEKLRALKLISDHIIKGRYDYSRKPNNNEMKATSVIKIKMEHVSGKMRFVSHNILFIGSILNEYICFN